MYDLSLRVILILNQSLSHFFSSFFLFNAYPPFPLIQSIVMQPLSILLIVASDHSPSLPLSVPHLLLVVVQQLRSLLTLVRAVSLRALSFAKTKALMEGGRKQGKDVGRKGGTDGRMGWCVYIPTKKKKRSSHTGRLQCWGSIHQRGVKGTAHARVKMGGSQEGRDEGGGGRGREGGQGNYSKNERTLAASEAFRKEKGDKDESDTCC